MLGALSMSVSELRLGTRGSQLALWQARAVAARITESGGPGCRVVVIRTSGDRLQDVRLSEFGGKGLFVKEIEEALLAQEIDLAVHSSKDMPALLPDGLTIAAVLPREDPRDAVVLPATVRLKPDPTYENQKAGATHEEHSASYVASGFSRTAGDPLLTIEELLLHLGQSPRIGTGSVRRVSQLTRLMPGANFGAIRGNLDTRLRKLDGGDYDALVLAAAGLHRLGFASRISLALPASACVPAPGQGIVAIEIRADDDEVRRAVARIDDPAAAAALQAERALVAALGGGCQTPIGALASPVDGNDLELVAAVVSIDGSRAIRGHARGPRRDAAALGARVGAQLLADGADQILLEARRQAVESRESSVDRQRSAATTDD
jgi:hydroxymethylbilane synthase